MSQDNKEWHNIPVSASHLKDEAEQALKKDIGRALAELIKNSIDGINRAKNHGENPSDIVNVSYEYILSKMKFECLDNAEGMDSKRLEKAARHGEKMAGLSEGEAVHGLFGAGLKHVMCSMEDAQTFTIKNGKLSRCLFSNNWKRKLDISDRDVSKDERKKFGIIRNGTLNSFILNKDWQKPMNIEKLGKKLDDLYLLRLINLRTDHKVILHDKSINKEREIRYEEPASTEFLNNNFKILHDGEEYEINIIIKISENELEPKVDDYSHRGLTLHNEDGVAYDHTLFRFNTDFFANRLFGYVLINKFNDLLKKDISVLGVHRLGLNYHHPFCSKLQEEIDSRLTKAYEKEKTERGSDKDRESFANQSKDALKEFSKIYNDLTGEGGGGNNPPKEPKVPIYGMSFFPKSTTVLENLIKRVYLVINKENIKENQIINLTKLNKEKSIVVPSKITYKPSKKYVDKNYDIIGINIKGFDVGASDVIVASSPNCKNDQIDVVIEEDPRQYISKGFGFYPENFTIGDGEERKVMLYVNKGKVKGKVAKIYSDNPKNITIATNMVDLTKGDKYVDEIIMFKISIRGRGIGKKADITSEINSSQSDPLSGKVVRIRFDGVFKDAILDKDDEHYRSSSRGDSKEGYIIVVHKNHPVINIYTKKGYQKNKSYWTIFADTVLNMATHLIARDTLIKEKFSIGVEPSFDEIESKRIDIEYKCGEKIHKLFLAKLEKGKMLEEDEN